jgi:hypothetical protein
VAQDSSERLIALPTRELGRALAYKRQEMVFM